MEPTNKLSFTSAGILPIKLFSDMELLDSLRKGVILPRHVQISPTNVCNLSCSFCSCRNRNKTEALDSVQLEKILSWLEANKTVGVTITGGGEPSLYPQINDLIQGLHDRNIRVGLVSNGTKISNITTESLDKCTWIRVSFGDDRVWDANFIQNMDYMRESGHDLAFSYVVGADYNFNNVQKILSYANNHSFTHVRLVSDIYKPSASLMESIKHRLMLEHLDDSLIIYQAREEYTHGTSRCLISLLKPLIAADGNIYPCCGVQYALNDVDRTFPERMIMGSLDDIISIWEQQEHFNGSMCTKCYYSNYNYLLSLLTSDIQHKEFL